MDFKERSQNKDVRSRDWTLGISHTEGHTLTNCAVLAPLITIVLCLNITDSIEANVESAAVHVETANVQLEKAKDYQVS